MIRTKEQHQNLKKNQLSKHLKKQYIGLDVLRGLGIFILVGLHSAFYYFDGLYDLDMENPPLVVTLIGLLLMFAGMFAIISGTAHMTQFIRRIKAKRESAQQIIKYFLVRGGMILVIAYTYFVFTGPGLVDFATRSSNNSILVDLIRYGIFKGFNFERLIYIDSLVMIGSNIILLGLFTAIFYKRFKSVENKWFSRAYLIGGLAIFALSIVRIPLYAIYIKAVTDGDYPVIIALNWLVNKNNPVLPYLAFGFFGMWIASMINLYPWKKVNRTVLSLASALLIIGVALYINLPDTMLQRGIDFKWYSIMMAQLGLFMIMVISALKLYDFRKTSCMTLGSLSKFVYRFSFGGLSVFFIESVFSACVYRVLKTIDPELSFSLGTALIYGFSLALFWGLVLVAWEKNGYKYGIEYFYGKIAAKFGGSAKQEKLEAAGAGSKRVKI